MGRPRSTRELIHSWVPFGLNETKPHHFREMLRIKRAVTAAHAQAAITQPRPGDKKRPRDSGGGADQDGGGGAPADAMAALEAEQQQQRAGGGEAGAFAEPAPKRMAADASALGFTAAGSWQGARPGFVFKMGELGLGYYRDGAASSARALASMRCNRLSLRTHAAFHRRTAATVLYRMQRSTACR